jgi:folate-dependent phosphoribosylglycinamide formyltransferase PurN
MIKTALLTIGNSPIADAAIRALAEYSHLEYVVYSRKKRKESFIRRIREYGLLYSLHALIGKVFSAVFSNLDEYKYAAADVIVWDDAASNEDILKALRGVDMVVCCLFNRVLNQSFIASFKYCVNFHPSLLPDYRGPEPIYWGLLNNETKFGLTLHHMTERIDEGDVISQSHCQRPAIPLVFFVEKKLASTVSEAVQSLLRQVAAGNVATKKQGEGFYLPAPTIENIKKFGSRLPKEPA